VIPDQRLDVLLMRVNDWIITLNSLLISLRLLEKMEERSSNNVNRVCSTRGEIGIIILRATILKSRKTCVLRQHDNELDASNACDSVRYGHRGTRQDRSAVQ
jgi:hypothetical protein